MRKEIKEVSKNIVQITTFDERWYNKAVKDEEGVLRAIFVPSVTWKAGYYPKGVGFYKWLAEKGWDEAQAVRQAAGDKGSVVHRGLEGLLAGDEVKMDSRYIDPDSNEEKELSVEEYECLMTFTTWFDQAKPVIIANELTLFNKEYNYAGTLDLLCRIDGVVYIIDFKTGQSIWEESKLQISAYSHFDLNLKELKITAEEWKNRKLAILQLGYRRNKAGFKFTEIPDKFDLFLVASKIWENECADIEPKQKDYPKSLKLKE